MCVTSYCKWIQPYTTVNYSLDPRCNGSTCEYSIESSRKFLLTDIRAITKLWYTSVRRKRRCWQWVPIRWEPSTIGRRDKCKGNDFEVPPADGHSRGKIEHEIECHRSRLSDASTSHHAVATHICLSVRPLAVSIFLASRLARSDFCRVTALFSSDLLVKIKQI